MWYSIAAKLIYAALKNQAPFKATSDRRLMGELRRDPIVDRLVIMAEERGRRPKEFVRPRSRERVEKCPFCPGNEWMTPPAHLVYLKGKEGIVKLEEGERVEGWLVRCFDNLYPALKPEEHGHHEVIVESPVHDEHIQRARLEQVRLVVEAYIDRVRELYRKDYVKYVLIFRNYGLEAGASLSHAHSQLIATPLIPRAVREEVEAFEDGCPFCRLIEDERRGGRVFYESEGFVALCPYASRAPFEFWILPKRHSPSITDMSGEEVDDFAKTLRETLGAMSELLGDPPYNYWIHIAPKGLDFHWHVEVLPKTSIWAGFELGSGIYINAMPPESASRLMREAVLRARRTS